MKFFAGIKMRKRLPLVRAAVFVFIFLWTGILLWSVIPSSTQTADFETIPVSLDDEEWINFHGSPVTLKPFRVEIESPKGLRPGENGKIFMRVNILSNQDIMGDGGMTEEISIIGLAEKYQIMAVTRLEIVGCDFTPPGEISRSIVPSGEQSYSFEWKINHSLPGEYSGTLWLSLWLNDPEMGRSYQFPLLARTVEFEVKNWGGVSISMAQWLSVIGLCLNIVIFWVITVSNRRYFMP